MCLFILNLNVGSIPMHAWSDLHPNGRTSSEASALNSEWRTALDRSPFYKWHSGTSETTRSHNGFLQHIHCPFHYSWCVCSDGALNHEEYSCLSSPEGEGERKSARAANTHTQTHTDTHTHTGRACFHLVLQKNRCPVMCGGAQRLIVWPSVRTVQGSCWMKHSVDELMEHFQVWTVCVSL